MFWCVRIIPQKRGLNPEIDVKTIGSLSDEKHTATARIANVDGSRVYGRQTNHER